LIVDSHTHILPDEFRDQRERWLAADRTFSALFNDTAALTASSEDLITEMDEAGVDVSVAMGYGWTDPDAARLSNDYLLAAAVEYPGRIVPFCSVDPSWGDAALKEVERCLSSGARGIGELHADTQGWSPEQAEGLRGIMALASEAAVPVLVHASEPVGHGYPGKGATTPERLLTLAGSFPDVAFIFAHFGGGLPFYALMPEVAETLSNVYFDSAATPFLYRPDVYAVSAAAAGSDRILFGSDFPLIRQGRAMRGVRGSGLNDADIERVLGENLVDLLGLKSDSGTSDSTGQPR
jgi:predicted TIM-barrel fold metal-dependent hydrolase